MTGLFDAVFLARSQFAFTIAFHIVFPSFTIGLASFLVVLEGLWLWRKQDVYLRLYKYWSVIFALSFGMGVVSGIVMSYQFGTNWGPFADQTGPILGPLLAYEVLTAFFLEAGFLGIMLFGMERVGKGLHFLATCLVALGTLISTFWIISANSWMNTPAGYAVLNGQYVPADWWAAVFNPSFPYRLVHMVLAAYLTTAFVVGAVGAFHLLRARRDAVPERAAARIMLSMAMWMALIVAPLQIVAGDFHGLNTLKYQPVKIAAIEGHWETRRGAPLILFGVPDMAAEETKYAVEIPKLGSLILAHDWNGELQGMKAWPSAERPNSTVVFWSFRLMVGLGLLMVAAGIVSVYLRWRGRLYDTPWFHRFVVLMGPSGFVAVIAGWFTTEVGRQPYVVYGLMRTADAVSPVGAPAVGGSLLAFILVYFAVFSVGITYMLRLMSRAPQAGEAGPRPSEPHWAAGLTPAPAYLAEPEGEADDGTPPQARR